MSVLLPTFDDAFGNREGVVDGFTKRHGLKMLVYAEHHDEIERAIQPEGV